MSRIQIHILTSHTIFRKGFHDFYPLIRWNYLFRDLGIYISYYTSHKKKEIASCDILIIDYRYLKNLVTIGHFTDINEIVGFISKVRSDNPTTLKVVLFDTGDGSGSRCFGITPYVDLHIKKQLLKDKLPYTVNNGDLSLMTWLPEIYTPSNIPYTSCRQEDLHKLKLGWNIGLLDYRYFPFARYFPINTAYLLNNLFSFPKFYSPSAKRTLLTSFRGSVRRDTRYSFQREILLGTIDKLSGKLPVISGKGVRKSEYNRELRGSRAVVSPYGWGEICYRDFECFINGALLIKPSMEHLETFPHYFKSNLTYIPLKWNLEDLEEVLTSVNSSYDDFLDIAERGQNVFKESLEDSEGFLDHFRANILSLI